MEYILLAAPLLMINERQKICGAIEVICSNYVKRTYITQLDYILIIRFYYIDKTMEHVFWGLIGSLIKRFENIVLASSI